MNTQRIIPRSSSKPLNWLGETVRTAGKTSRASRDRILLTLFRRNGALIFNRTPKPSTAHPLVVEKGELKRRKGPVNSSGRGGAGMLILMDASAHCPVGSPRGKNHINLPATFPSLKISKTKATLPFFPKSRHLRDDHVPVAANRKQQPRKVGAEIHPSGVGKDGRRVHRESGKGIVKLTPPRRPVRRVLLHFPSPDCACSFGWIPPGRQWKTPARLAYRCPGPEYPFNRKLAYLLIVFPVLLQLGFLLFDSVLIFLGFPLLRRTTLDRRRGWEARPSPLRRQPPANPIHPGSRAAGAHPG